MEASEVVGFTGRSRGGCEGPGRSNKRGVSFKACEQPPPPPPAGASALDNASQIGHNACKLSRGHMGIIFLMSAHLPPLLGSNLCSNFKTKCFL